MKLRRKTKVFDYERIEIRALINKNIFDEAKKVVKEKTSLDLPNTQVFSFALNEFIKKNRLELLQMLCKAFDNYINFSNIEG